MILRMLRYFSGSWPAMAAVALTAFVSAGAEVVAVVSLVPLLHGLTDASPSIVREFGPVQLELDRAELAALAVGAVVVYGLALALGVVLRARLAMGWEAAERREIQRTFLAADWSVKALERDGHLQQVGAFATAAAQGLGRLSQLMAVSLSLGVLMLAALAVEWRSAVMIAGVGLVLFAVLRPLSMRVKRRGRASGDAMLALGLEIGEVVDHVREIELYGVADRFVERMDERIEHARAARERTLVASQIVSPIYRSLGLLVVVALVMVVTELESIDVAAFGAVALLMLRCLSYSQQFQLLHANLAEDLASIELLEEEMERYASHRAVTGDVQVEGPLRIELVGAGYSYDGVEEALAGLDLVIEPGERIGVIGVSGGGKSTLAQILTRLRSPSSGAHLVDGRPAADYEEASWRRAVQFLPQEVKLLHGTVSDNIAFERRDVPASAIEEAARRAGVHETVLALPDGYDTRVGTASRALSGGQVQRLGLARALVCAPRLLVLDEPTSALDADTEAAITDMLAGIDRSVTIVIIAHRLSTLTQCDRIIELAGGRIVRTGSPHDLLPVIDERAVL